MIASMHTQELSGTVPISADLRKIIERRGTLLTTAWVGSDPQLIVRGLIPRAVWPSSEML